MALLDLEYLFSSEENINFEDQVYTVPNLYKTPGFWVTLAQYMKSKKRSMQTLCFEDSDHRRYAEAIKLGTLLNSEDKYEYQRINSGVNYAPLTQVDTHNEDSASETINSCVRAMTNSNHAGIQSLCKVIGELHNNVVAHSTSTGISMAQKWHLSNRQDHYLEFAIADDGIGFLEELKTNNIPKCTDEEAIRWCLLEGKSSKLVVEDEWAQSVPEDCMYSPYGNNVPVRSHSQNHHQGLGLYHLNNLVTEFNGSLTIVTGSCLYSLKEDGKAYIIPLSHPWKGVIIACRLKESKLNKKIETSQDIDELMKRLEEK